MAKRHGWTDALVVRCPSCHQPPKAKCRSKETGKPKRWAHPARVRDFHIAVNETKD